ncbi:Rrf2 family transcriptional regulator [Liquorilactobacillus satsumensis]|uniref:Transcription regulator n=1 Tax=Liquorilactobacillus satsumensis DSM 16230 = JCM 12392 TaxID=1423801 RepID=A0A0R1V3H7_9LACO|nr:Rrf2 family transcriptional regulator [Liquorilactobacillus satsumensis]KRL97800.1 transcription regulator [Liquorilactobacillus satsumensis DSM 16230 = JCM 12392]MCC7666137.1 Rrf2 family transcriptional regulator [Liquorilactobacillus satsumensis]MCP9313549.1 Rrf2 family transcriptional regulator [Liquorilactobacillus satsumensis]MCP9329181.1 Rrf2 family transcriptional regulator [Liquorilactobacillus satsumensis]MCP9357404.1 Rrf2 family transcriptional regulator [Liquorilactobacillus sats
MANNRLSDLIHILVFIHTHEHQKSTSALIASSINTNPSLTRRMMGQLRKASLLETTQGTAAPRLTKAPGEITLFEIYLATQPKEPLLKVDHNTSKKCVIGNSMPHVLNKYYLEVQRAAEARMQQITLQDIITDVKSNIESQQPKTGTTTNPKSSLTF